MVTIVFVVGMISPHMAAVIHDQLHGWPPFIVSMVYAGFCLLLVSKCLLIILKQVWKYVQTSSLTLKLCFCAAINKVWPEKEESLIKEN